MCMKKTKNLKERILSIVLTLTMVVSLFAGMTPVEAQAEGGTYELTIDSSKFLEEAPLAVFKYDSEGDSPSVVLVTNGDKVTIPADCMVIVASTISNFEVTVNNPNLGTVGALQIGGSESGYPITDIKGNITIIIESTSQGGESGGDEGGGTDTPESNKIKDLASIVTYDEDTKTITADLDRSKDYVLVYTTYEEYEELDISKEVFDNGMKSSLERTATAKRADVLPNLTEQMIQNFVVGFGNRQIAYTEPGAGEFVTDVDEVTKTVQTGARLLIYEVDSEDEVSYTHEGTPMKFYITYGIHEILIPAAGTSGGNPPADNTATVTFVKSNFTGSLEYMYGGAFHQVPEELEMEIEKGSPLVVASDIEFTLTVPGSTLTSWYMEDFGKYLCEIENIQSDLTITVAPTGQGGGDEGGNPPAIDVPLGTVVNLKDELGEDCIRIEGNTVYFDIPSEDERGDYLYYTDAMSVPNGFPDAALNSYVSSYNSKVGEEIKNLTEYDIVNDSETIKGIKALYSVTGEGWDEISPPQFNKLTDSTSRKTVAFIFKVHKDNNLFGKFEADENPYSSGLGNSFTYLYGVYGVYATIVDPNAGEKSNYTITLDCSNYTTDSSLYLKVYDKNGTIQNYISSNGATATLQKDGYLIVGSKSTGDFEVFVNGTSSTISEQVQVEGGSDWYYKITDITDDATIVVKPKTAGGGETPPSTSGNVVVDVVIKTDEHIKSVKINTTADEIIKKGTVFSADEVTAIQNGTSAAIRLEVTEMDANTVEEADRVAIEAKAAELGVNPNITYFDASLFKLIGTNPKVPISDAGIEFEITLKIPTELLNTDATKTRTYQMLRYHDGEGVTNLGGTFNNGEFTFTTSKFSTYAIVYKDTVVTNPGGGNPGGSNPGGGNSGGGGGISPSYPSTGGSSSGGSTGGSTGGTQITVPVKNPETAVNVTAKVDANKATVDAIKDEDLAKVTNTKEETTIEIDLIGLDRTIDTVVIPTESMEKIVKAVEDKTNKVEGLTVRLDTAVVTLDAKALSAVVGQADGDNIQLNVDDVHTARLNTTQLKAVEKLDVHKGVEAYFTCNGRRIGDFKGGEVKVELPFEVPAGYNPTGFSVWYVDDNGNTTKYKSNYKDGKLSFVVDHFSDFIVVYDAADVEVNTAFHYLRLRGKETTEDSIKLVWNAVEDADGYVLYGNKCNANGKKYTIKKIKTIKDGDVSKLTVKDLEEGTYYKYYIKAYKLVDGKKVILGKSKTVHVTTDGGKYGNAKAVKVNETEVTLKAGETFAIKAEQLKKDKPIAKHTTIKFESNKSTVAKVNKNGTVTAKKKGTAIIYVYAQNGVYEKVKVTVK